MEKAHFSVCFFLQRGVLLLPSPGADLKTLPSAHSRAVRLFDMPSTVPGASRQTRLADSDRAATPVQLLWVDLDDTHWDGFVSVLSQDENSKAGRFQQATLQQRYRRCRCALRMVLSQYSGQNASHIEFQYGDFGKPELKNPDFHFNLGHSGSKAIIGLSPEPLGVDIEYLGGMARDIDNLIELVCHGSERQWLNLMSEDERLRMFYYLWTQKEAYCKMLGTGLGKDPKAFKFEPLDGGPCVEVMDGMHKDNHNYFVGTSFSMAGHVISICGSNRASIMSATLNAATPDWIRLDKDLPFD